MAQSTAWDPGKFLDLTEFREVEEVLRKGKDFVVAGTERVEPSLALEHLSRLGHRSVLLEGGPGLNADVVKAGRMDELCLTLSP